jgi:hypothetical protein
MAEFKPITREGVPAALQKAHRYRLLNDSQAAESICEDVLAVDPGNADAIVTLLLAITDQFVDSLGDSLVRAREAAARLEDPYRNAYYNGIICERWAKAHLKRGAPRSSEIAHEWLTRAMQWYDQAERIRPAGNDEAILRWNTCVRIMARKPEIQPREVEEYEPTLNE